MKKTAKNHEKKTEKAKKRGKQLPYVFGNDLVGRISEVEIDEVREEGHGE